MKFIKSDTYAAFLFLCTSIFVKYLYVNIAIFIHNLSNTKQLSYIEVIKTSSINTPLQYMHVLLIAPVFETAIFISLVHKITAKSIKNDLTFIIMSATIFGAWHFKSINHQVSAFFSGIIYAYCYIYFLKKHPSSPNKAAFIVISVHALHNLFNLITSTR